MVDGVETCVDTCSVCPADTGCIITNGVATCTPIAACEWATPCPPGYVCEVTGCVATCDVEGWGPHALCVYSDEHMRSVCECQSGYTGDGHTCHLKGNMFMKHGVFP